MTTPQGIVGEFEEQDRPKGCLWVTQDHCRNPMRGIEDGCYKCLAGKVNKARLKAGQMADRFIKSIRATKHTNRKAG